MEGKLQTAVALHGHGQLAQAQAIYEEILRAMPRHADALHLLGVIAAARGDPRRAVELIGRAIELIPGYAPAHNNHGAALQELGQWEAALASYDRAATLDRAYADPHYNRGISLKSLRQWEGAAASFAKAIGLRADYAEAHYQLGNVRCELRQWEAALDSFSRTIALNQAHAEAHSNRAVALRELARLDEALASCDRAVAIQSDFAGGHSNRGGVLVAMNRPALALKSYDKAIEIDPQYAAAYVNRAMVRLLMGDFAGGWSDYEWRWKDPSGWIIQEKRNYPQPLWSGKEVLTGKTVLLHSEQGYGDTIQFCRYAKLLAGLGATVILQVPDVLATLMQSLDGVTRVVVRGEAPPAFDYYCPLLDLPLAMKTTLSNVPVDVPYLHADPVRSRRWQVRLGERSGPRVGLVWSGGFRPSLPQLWSGNNRRNLPLAALASLKLPGIQYYSLQKGPPAEAELAALVAESWPGPNVVDLTGEIIDFADTAAFIEQLDLVISVDTATAHLAGALGKPVWILNRFDTCWRWLLDRSDSPWYPSARLYRQEQPDDWSGVIHRVHQDLITLFDCRIIPCP